ncbi:MAG: PAS domain S-box protein [Thermodesulfovibrionales bacterium]|nr:PAS domain S-box protein [Thermodesulfovibrionales bacterium]
MRKSNTSRKKEKESAKETNTQILKDIAQAEGIVSAIGDGIRILDRTFMVLYDNQVHKNMMGDHIGEYCYKAYKKQESICSDCPVELVFRDEIIHTVRRELQTDTGKRYLEITASPLKDKTGKIIAGIEIIRDITKHKQAETGVIESERRLKNIIEHSNELYYTHDIHHVLSYASPQSLQILGYTPEEMMIEWTRLATDNPINEKGIEVTEKALKTGESQGPYLLELYKKDRSKVLLEIDESPIKDVKGNVIGIVGAARDVTERKQAEIALQYSEERYRSTIDFLDDAIHVTDKNFTIILVNKKLLEWHQQFGLEEDAIGKNVFQVYAFLPDSVREEYESVFTAGTPITTEESMHISGREVITETKKIPIFEGSNVIKVITIMRDITERKKTEEEMKRSRAELKERIKELEEFYDMAVGRELRMVELKREREQLREQLERYMKAQPFSSQK